MPAQIKTLRFAARADRATTERIWHEAWKAHRHFNEIITANLDIRSRTLFSISDRKLALKKKLRHLAALKKAKQASDNQAANKKVKLPKEWLARYKRIVDRIKGLMAALPADPDLERVQDQLRALREGRGKGRIKDEAQEEHDQRMLACAAQHPIALNQVQLEIEGRQKLRDLRAASGCHCSTYMLTEEAADKALKTWRARRRVWRLRDQHRVGIGVVANNGTPIEWSKLTRKRAEGWANYELDVRFGGKGSPVHTIQFKNHREWAKQLHRIPEGAEIRTAWLQLVKRKYDHWDLELCVTTAMPIATPRPGTRVVGIDAGFRAVGENRSQVRVASLSTGQHIDTPAAYRGMIAQAQDLRGTADRMTLDYWSRQCGEVPKHAGRPWSVRKLHRVIMDGSYVRETLSGKGASLRWKAGDRSFEVYRLQFKHLQQWASALDEKARRIRKEHYRVVAARLAQDHDIVGEEALRLDNMAKSKIAGGNRAEASPSEFRNAVRSACQTYGARHVKVPAQGTSQRCANCRTEHPIGVARDGEKFECPTCGHTAHADTNAACNIRQLAIEIASANVVTETRVSLAAE